MKGFPDIGASTVGHVPGEILKVPRRSEGLDMHTPDGKAADRKTAERIHRDRRTEGTQNLTGRKKERKKERKKDKKEEGRKKPSRSHRLHPLTLN